MIKNKYSSRKGDNKMNLSTNRNQDGVIITLSQACQEFNLGETIIRRIAKECGAVRKIGRCYRINKKIFLAYIEKTYAE